MPDTVIPLFFLVFFLIQESEYNIIIEKQVGFIIEKIPKVRTSLSIVLVIQKEV